MIRISQLKLDVHHTDADLKTKICRLLRIKEDAILSYTRKKQSLDARKKPRLFYVYTVDVEVKNENELKKRIKKQNLSNIQFQPEDKRYFIEVCGEKTLAHRPVVIGTGPAGLFCGYELARLGYRPILLERGGTVDERIRDVEAFWNTGVLNPHSNVQFGEGGAGTFSDGKLNTLVHDAEGRNRRVLEIFVENGAPKEILYQNKPHIGTDILADVVKNMREYIISRGGEVRFHSQVIDLMIVEKGGVPRLSGLKIIKRISRMETNILESENLESEILESEILESENLKPEILETETAILAIGHSARDTFAMLKSLGVPMEAKSFAVGVRMEHPQSMVNLAQYGIKDDPDLSPAAYKLTANLPNGRGVYTFCMCPGGYVVNASSEEKRLAVNGMSYHARDGINANSAVVVTVSPDDYKAKGQDFGVLSGMEFQRRLEEAAYQAGKGNIPVQLFEDFCNNRPSLGPAEILPQMKGGYTWGNVRAIFPEELAESLEEGIRSFGKRLKGYDHPDAVVSGVESRTSSPVRILRDDTMQSRIQGLYPCGEGAGYAGGITSAAMDGLKVTEAIAAEYRVL